MGVDEVKEAVSLFNMEYLSSVTAMVMAVNLITQVLKEVFLREGGDERIPKIITFVASGLIISVHHYLLWTKNPTIFGQSILEMVFLMFLNTILISGLSMGNYKVLNLTKDKEVKRMKEELFATKKNIMEQRMAQGTPQLPENDELG